ncbi:hypothetical protein LOTGIDRAFT_161583 [Lottia gigantea]|uniref:Uncharacterized protein n=1 Tax=Lottia gigantea TaxID=225164 RepID=V4AIZ8_LOTGI|nr:hypothetical protein LOTGIDRAFT_161583 [Lottia gigantea]ESO93481.1 hypothetical protein LOTGIDRAFT_161583 [Lottia gigantea]
MTKSKNILSRCTPLHGQIWQKLATNYVLIIFVRHIEGRRWKRYIMNFLGYHYWFFYLSNPHSFGIFSTTVKTLLTFFAETSFMFSNIMCYIVYHEPDGVMNLSASVYVGSLLALFSSSIVILGIEYALCNIRPTFQRQYHGLPIAFVSNDTTERLKNLEVYWEGSDASSSTDEDSDIKISGPIAEIRSKKAAIKAKEALEAKMEKKKMAKNRKRTRRNRRQFPEKRNNDTVTEHKDSENRAKDQSRVPTSGFEGSRKNGVKFAPNVNKSNPRLNKSCDHQQVDHFQKETDHVSVDLTPIEVKHLWFKGRQSSKRLPGEHMKIYTDSNDVWETGSSRTSLLTIDSVQNSSYAPHDTPLSLCERGQVTQDETNLNFSSSTDTGARCQLLDTTRKFATRTWNMISNADIKKWWFEDRTPDKPAQGEHLHNYKTHSEDWETKSSRSSLSEISEVPQQVIDSLRPKIDNFDLTPSDSVTFKSESDTSVHLTKSIEMQSGTSDDQLLCNKGPNKNVKSYRSTRTAELHPNRRKRRLASEKQNNATYRLTSNGDTQIGGSLSALALQYLKQAVPVVYASSPEDDDDDDGSVRFIHNTKKKNIFDVLSPSKVGEDSQKIEPSPSDNNEIPTAEITSLIRKKSKRAPDSASSYTGTPCTDTEGFIKQPQRKSSNMLHSGLPLIQEFDPDTRPKVIAFNVKPEIQGSSSKFPTRKYGPSSSQASEASQETTAVTPSTCTIGLAAAASLGGASITAPDIASSPAASSVNQVTQTSPIIASKASPNYSLKDVPDVVSVASSDSTIPDSPEMEPEASPEASYTILNVEDEDAVLEFELEKQFEEFMTILNDPYSDEAMDLYFGTKKQMPDILEIVSYCTAFRSQSGWSIDPSSASVRSPSSCSSATTVRENNYRIKDHGISSSMEMLEKIAEAVSKHIPGSSRSASTVTGSLSLQDNTSNELRRLSSETSCRTTFTDPYLLRPLYPSEYRITDSDFLSKCQFSWLTSATDSDKNFIPNLLQIILLDIDSLMTNDRTWASLGKKTRTWYVMVCRNLWNQIQTHMLDRDFVIKQDIRLKRIQNREKEENFSQVVSGSSSSEIDLNTLLSATAVSDESERSEARCVLLDQEVDCYCDCGRTECNQVQNIFSDLLLLASSILSQTVSDLYKLISQSERISQEALLDLCDSINRSIEIASYDLAAVAIEPDLITCYEDLWSFPVDPGHQVLASIIVHKSLRRGAAIYEFEWHLGKRAYFLVSEVIDAAVGDVGCEIYEDTVIAKLCQDAIKEATQEVLQDFADPIHIFTQHAIKHKLIRITKDIVRSQHRLSFIEDVVKLLASLWRLEGLDLSVDITSRLVEALITRIFKEQLKDTRIFSNLVQLKEIEQGINRFVRTAILCATNNLLVCIENGEPLNQANLTSIIEQVADSDSKESKEAQGISVTAEKTQRQTNNLPNVQKDRRLSKQYSSDKGRSISTIRKMPQILAEEINFNIDVASAAVYYYLVDQSSIIFDEYTFDLEISSMVDDIILKARNSLIADQLRKIAMEEKAERSNIYSSDEFAPSDMYLKMKSCLISYDVLMDAQISLIEDSIGDPFTLDSKEIYDLRKELGPLKMYSEFLDQDIQNRNKQEMIKELKRYSKRHRDYVTINLQNVADSQCITNNTPNYDDRDLYLLEWLLRYIFPSMPSKMIFAASNPVPCLLPNLYGSNLFEMK